MKDCPGPWRVEFRRHGHPSVDDGNDHLVDATGKMLAIVTYTPPAILEKFLEISNGQDTLARP